MEKIKKCPNCSEEPVLTLYLEHPERYIEAENIPDSRVYALTCIACGYSIEHFTVDNTITAVKALRTEMDQLYGKSFILNIWHMLKEVPSEKILNTGSKNTEAAKQED